MTTIRAKGTAAFVLALLLAAALSACRLDSTRAPPDPPPAQLAAGATTAPAEPDPLANEMATVIRSLRPGEKEAAIAPIGDGTAAAGPAASEGAATPGLSSIGAKLPAALLPKSPTPPAPAAPAPTPNPAGGYCASANSKVFHLCSCRAAQNIKPGNLKKFSSRAEAAASGRRPCKSCSP